jgi:anti-sigma factor RsiW
VRAGPACLDMDALLAERASGDLPAEERPRVDAHLSGCARCRAELAGYEGVLELVRASAAPSSCAAGGPDLAASTLRRWRRDRRRRVFRVAAVAGSLAAAAAVALALAPGLLGEGAPRRAETEVLRRAGNEMSLPAEGEVPRQVKREVPRPAQGEVLATSWEPDVDGALEASGFRRGWDQDEDASAVDVVLTAFDAVEEE